MRIALRPQLLPSDGRGFSRGCTSWQVKYGYHIGDDGVRRCGGYLVDSENRWHYCRFFFRGWGGVAQGQHIGAVDGIAVQVFKSSSTLLLVKAIEHRRRQKELTTKIHHCGSRDRMQTSGGRWEETSLDQLAPSVKRWKNVWFRQEIPRPILPSPKWPILCRVVALRSTRSLTRVDA